MTVKLALAAVAFLAAFCKLAAVNAENQVVCYYDSKGSFRQDGASFHPKYLAEAVPNCNYLIYGFAAINKNSYQAEPLNPAFDVHQYKTYEEVVNLKNSNPNLRVLLSIGGGRDLDCPEKYLTLLEHPDKRHVFVATATDLVKKFGFDGVDLAWQFPTNKPKIVSTGFWNKAWNKIKSPFTSAHVDPKAHEHQHQFTELVDEMRKSCRNKGLTLSLSVLPNVNSSLFFNIPEIIHNLDFVNLWAFDYFTPERNPKEADIPAPLYEQPGRIFDENGDCLVRHWCDNGAPRNKLFFGIPTYGRTWKTTTPAASCLPPIFDVNGPGVPGHHTKEPGLLSFPEIYPKLSEPITTLGTSTAVKEGFSSNKYATYALIASEGSLHRDTWVGFEDVDTVSYKATYAHLQGLAGVALVDLSFDDFKGICTGVKYPLLRAATLATPGTRIPVTTVPPSILSQEDPITHRNVAPDQGVPQSVPDQNIPISSVVLDVAQTTTPEAPLADKVEIRNDFNTNTQ